ncbi:MAG: SPASM domain-containing protein, partial [Candidatus Electrothrix sp. AR3]|nr:SPASM domain-containing protein [Candidatus Electrothrix sp. AR3]
IVTPVSEHSEDTIDQKSMIVIVDSIISSYKERGNFKYTIYNVQRIINTFLSPYRATSCGIGSKKITLSFNGNLFPCHRFVSYSEYLIGNVCKGINEDKIEHINISEIYSDHCRGCQYIFLCGGVCVHEYLNSKNKLSANYLCMFNKTIISAVLRYMVKNQNEFQMKNISNDTGCYQENLLSVQQAVITKCPNATTIDLEEEGIVCNHDKRYVLNSTGMAIWDLIDGQRTAQEITQEIANVCEVESETIKDDIYGQLAAFQELGLVEEVQAESHA